MASCRWSIVFQLLFAVALSEAAPMPYVGVNLAGAEFGALFAIFLFRSDGSYRHNFLSAAPQTFAPGTARSEYSGSIRGVFLFPVIFSILATSYVKNICVHALFAFFWLSLSLLET